MELLDCTLRDGSYAVDFQLDEEFVAVLLSRLGKTPVSKIEVGHGIGVEAERAGIRAGNIDHYQWCELAASALPTTPWGMFAQPEFTRLETIAGLSERGMSFVRIGMEAEKISDHLDYLARATGLCGQVYLNLMKSSSIPVADMVAAVAAVPAGIAGVYIVDSYGAMLPEDVRRYVGELSGIVPVVGFHGHDNLGLATINTLTAAQAGAKIVDATLNGIGRGAGNAAIESLAGIIKILDGDLFDYEELAQLAEYCRVNMDVIGEDRGMQVLGGVIGIHSGFFPLVEELAAEVRTGRARLMEAAADLAVYSPGRADIQAAAQKFAHQGS